jgi:Na+(H+)/acetate symporter ActP
MESEESSDCVPQQIFPEIDSGITNKEEGKKQNLPVCTILFFILCSNIAKKVFLRNCYSIPFGLSGLSQTPLFIFTLFWKTLTTVGFAHIFLAICRVTSDQEIHRIPII